MRFWNLGRRTSSGSWSESEGTSKCRSDFVSCAKVTLQLRITATLRTVSQEQLAAQRQDFGTAKETSFKRKVKVEKQSYLAKMTSAEQTKEERIDTPTECAGKEGCSEEVNDAITTQAGFLPNAKDTGSEFHS